MSDLVARPFEGKSGADRDGLARLFAACGCSCFCRYWHFEGDKNEWLARAAFAADESERELRARAVEESDEARGVIALSGDEIVGWAKVAPAASLPKLYGQRFYRGLASLTAAPRDGVFAIGCVLVHPAQRGGGAAHALARSAVELAREAGARALEAFPRVVDGRVSDEELWMGPLSAFVAAGLRVVEDSRPYPVFRIDLGGRKSAPRRAASR